MSNLKNIIVGQSGGPTAAINATLAGVIRAGVENEKVGKVYGMVNGIAGMIDKKIVDLDASYTLAETTLWIQPINFKNTQRKTANL